MKPFFAMFLFSPLIFAQSQRAPVSYAAKFGPAPGSKAPQFEAKDQLGNPQSLVSLRGPKGLILLFIRSADW